MVWRKLVTKRHLVLRHTLLNGQCFGWSEVDDTFIGVVNGVGVQLKEDQGDVLYRTVTGCHNASAISTLRTIKAERKEEEQEQGDESDNEESLQSALQSYFQLETDLPTLYSQWGMACARAQLIGKHLQGMRILRQEPVECLLSFICSSNNNISRIKQMMQKLRIHFGTPLSIEPPSIQQELGISELFQFPSLLQLSNVSEQQLRELGFGYRAKYVVKTVSKLLNRENGGEQWLLGLRAMDQSLESLDTVRNELLTLDGVGPKVADCVALFCLDRRGVVPVDTHVWNIACRDFDRTLLEAKSLTPTVYNRVGDLFRERYGEYAGWAHSLLFAAELPLYQPSLPATLVQEMADFAKLEKERKQALKKRKSEDLNNDTTLNKSIKVKKDNAIKKEKKITKSSKKRKAAEPSRVVRQKIKRQV